MVSDGIINKYITWYGGDPSIPIPITPQTISLPPGVYFATAINNGVSCSDQISFTIGSSTSYNFSNSITNASCNGGLGGINVSMNTAGTYKFEWIGIPISAISNTSTTSIVTGIHTGTYTLKITESNSCNYQYVDFQVTEPIGFSNNGYVVTNALCNGGSNGAITQSISPTPTSYNWNSGQFSTQNIAGLQAGIYNCVVANGSGCSQTFTYFVSQPQEFAIRKATETPACFNSPTAGVEIEVCGGTPNATNPGYSLSTVAHTWNYVNGSDNHYTLSNVNPTSYTVTVTDFVGCIGTLSMPITSFPAPSISIPPLNINNVSCYGLNNGSATAVGSGGTSPYLYSWNTSPPQNGITASGLSSGTYTCTVTDAHGCTASASVTITQPSALVPTIPNPSQVTCNGLHNGSATVVPGNGGTSPYLYSWNTSPPQNGITASGLSPGTYTCTVTDAHGCTASANVTITQPSVLVPTISNPSQVTCNGLHNGSAIVVPGTGGTSPYLYSWNTSPPQNGITASGLSPGTYTCTVTDVLGCTASASVTITQPSALIVTPYSSNNTCLGSTNACSYANPSGGTSSYYYSWNTTPVQTTSPICNLNNGTYTVTVTDSKGCTQTGSVSVITSGICCGNFSNSLPQTISTTNMTTGSNYSDGLNLIFHHEVSSNCVLNNNIIEMEEAQYIIVHAPYTLTLNGSTIRGCGNMWKGIILEDGANIVLNNSYIYDAENAIHVMGTGNLQISQSHLINNNVGILYEPFNTHSGIFSIDQSEFRGTGSMKGQYHNQTTVIGTVPQAGIILNNFDVNLSSSNNPNVFRQMNSGFVIFDGTVSINNAQFVDIQPDPLINGNIFDGCGVYDDEPNSWGNSLTFQGYSFPHTNLNFSGCSTGIRAEEININISDCNMGASAQFDMETGIHYLYGNTLSSFIAYNSINATKFGINMELLDGADQVTVTGNSIGIGNINSGIPVSGIRLSNWGSFNYHGANPKYNIYHNYITLINNVDNGIEFQNVNNFGLIDNHIFPSDNVLQVKGISLSGCHQNEISCNSVESSDPNYSRLDQAGIFAVKSNQNRYGCNIVDNTYNGFLFSLDCANSEMFGNTIKNHYVGIHIDALGVIGQQPLVYPGSALPGNIWNGNCFQWDAWDENPTIDRYYYNNTTPSSYWQMVPQTFWPPSWFVPVPDRNFECGPYNVTGSYNPNPYCGNGTLDFGGGEGGGT